MRQILVLVTVAASALSQSAVPIHACGDKLMMLGRGIRFWAVVTGTSSLVHLF